MMKPLDNDVIHSKANWYQVESRLREVVHKVLDPIVTRMLDDRTITLKTEQKVKDHSKKLKELEEYVFYWKREESLAKN